jgi:hypothetical protein
MLLGNQWFRRVKNRGREGTERREWQAYPGSCATSSQISMFFAQSISLSLSLVAAFTISAAIFSPRLLHPITRSLLSLPSKSRPVIIHRTGREEIPVSCNEAIPSVKIAPLSTKPQPARSHSALAEGGRRRRCNLELEDRIDGRGREAVARTNLDRPQVHPRRAASRFGLATAVARPWRRRHAHWISDLSRGRGICQNMSMYVAALQNIRCLGELVKKFLLIKPMRLPPRSRGPRRLQNLSRTYTRCFASSPYVCLPAASVPPPTYVPLKKGNKATPPRRHSVCPLHSLSQAIRLISFSLPRR